MASEYSINNAAGLSNKKDFLSLVNKILLDTYGIEYKKISQKELMLLCNVNSVRGHSYRTFTIPKKSGGRRTISAPNPRLKQLLKAISIILESLYEPSACVMGFTQGRSVVDNANAHLGQNYILNLDLKDFFPSISEYRVRHKLQQPPFNFSKEIAGIIASSCSVKWELPDIKKHVIPQGSPASPVLTNIICTSLDRKLTGLAARFHLKYTRYADDMTFSSMHTSMNGENIYSPNSVFFTELRSIIEKEGFTINESKTRLQKKGSRQEVTGLTVGQKANVSKKYIKELDILLYVWNKHGYNAAFARMAQGYYLTGKKRTSIPRLEQVVQGKLNYLRMVKGKNDPVFLKYWVLFCELNEAKKKLTNGDFYFIASYSLKKFRQNFGVDLTVKHLKTTVSVSFELNGTRHKIHTSKAVDKIIEANQPKLMKKLYISLCSKNGRCSWILHNGLPLVATEVAIDLHVDSHTLISTWQKNGIEEAIKTAEESRIEYALERAAKLKKDDGSLEYKLEVQQISKLGVLDKSVFIRALLNDTKLSKDDKATLADLIYMEMEKEPKVVTMERIVEKAEKKTAKSPTAGSFVHNPELVVRFLKEFGSGKSTHIRYSTHAWEREFDNYDDFVQKVEQALKSNTDYQKLYDCNISLTQAIRAYILPYESGLGKIPNNQWGIDKIKIGIQYPKDIIKGWMDENRGKEISEMPLSVLPEQLRPKEKLLVNGKKPSNFEDIITAFKSLIEFRTSDASSMYYAIRKIFKSADINLNIGDQDSLKAVQVYTYTPAIINAFSRIMENVKTHSSEGSSVEILCRDCNEYYEIHILHKNSYADIDLSNEKLRTGTYSKLKKSLRSLCDFSIESRFLDGSKKPVNKRLVFLDKDSEYSDDSTFRVMDCTEEPTGFDHIFKFYK